MPATYSYPGVYVEEVPSGVRTITGVSSSNTAFIGYFTRGEMNKAHRITSFADFERIFGGLDSSSETSYAIQQYYQNGGSIAFVVRVAVGSPSPASVMLQGGSPLSNTLDVKASSEGEWGRNLRVAVTAHPSDPSQFNLTVREVVQVNGRDKVQAEKSFLNLTMDTTSPRFVESVINSSSMLIKVTNQSLGEIPTPSPTNADGSIPDSSFVPLTGGGNGNVPDAAALEGSQSDKTGIYALDDIAPEIFNIMCIPAAAELGNSEYKSIIGKATVYSESKRAFLIIDIPESEKTDSDMRDWMTNTGDGLRNQNVAVYFPRVEVPDPLNEYRPKNIGASGTMAGIYARTDSTRGVWKAPAGTDADLRGVTVAKKLTDLENGGLNPMGVNVLRSFPVYGNISWGARTMDGADQMASEWKYIPVRRTALYIEESLFQGLKWVVFEPNDEPLWAQIRLNVGAFMHGLFRQGAFQGSTPKEAYLVKCDSETTTQNDINAGIVNILVGFAPLKPAEFVVIKIQQIAGQVQT
jgi:phage tail sheath protein FI